jgi:hypothetical protein
MQAKIPVCFDDGTGAQHNLSSWFRGNRSGRGAADDARRDAANDRDSTARGRDSHQRNDLGKSFDPK